MTLAISEILEKASKKRTKAEKVKFLQDNYTPSLGEVIQFALHPNVKILLPEGDAPYKPSEMADENMGVLYNLVNRKQLHYFVEGGPPVTKNKREGMFIQMLESIHPKDAELLVAAKDKKLPYKGLSKEVITEAFPGILGEQA